MGMTAIESIGDEEAIRLLRALQQRYTQNGQNLSCYLEKLLYEKSLEYSDYLQTEVLLSLQQPKTDFPDEMVFIGYHQVVELYFKLILWELEQLTSPEKLVSDVLFWEKVKRINRYYEKIIASFDIMSDGLDREQFGLFRKALFPASGFQSLQYRLIEIMATDLINLVAPQYRAGVAGFEKAEDVYPYIYWKTGSLNKQNGEKNLTLRLFEKRYDAFLTKKTAEAKHSNLWAVFCRHYQASALLKDIAAALRDFDYLANVVWCNMHYKAVARHLMTREGEPVGSTAGTNWRQYLAPHFQQIVFFPDLWNETELKNWGTMPQLNHNKS